MPQIFFDTYAVIELIKGNPNYEKYLDYIPVINDFVLAELYYAILKDYGESKASNYLEIYSKVSIRISKEEIKSAMNFRRANSKKKMSLVDCIGYMHAKSMKIKFLTGDKEFQHLDNVEFVK